MSGLLDAWQGIIPHDVRRNLERWGSAPYVLACVAESRRVGKVVPSPDTTARYWAQRILGPSYPLESADEAGWRHLSECTDEECRICEEEKTMLWIPRP